jgi:alkanesulfonate monooxygenase SsuD/methylene tetrahydromethanopterin reductase-like flavin-dependent oxidoreductase (luciferase family)
MRVGVLPFALGTSFPDLVGSWRAAEEAGFAALWTVDYATATGDLRPAWEASSLLVAMVGCTQTIPVGVLVFDVLLRHPFIVAGSVAVAQALSGGRVRVGLGVGDKFSQLDHEALGLPFAPVADRVRFLEACCPALHALWRGEAVTDPLLGLKDASLGPIGIEPPPLIVGGASRALMEVAARDAQGWNLFTQDPEAFAAAAATLKEVEAATGRNESIARSVYLFVERAGRDLRGLLEDFEAAGAEEAMLVLMKPNRESVLGLAHEVL